MPIAKTAALNLLRGRFHARGFFRGK